MQSCKSVHRDTSIGHEVPVTSTFLFGREAVPVCYIGDKHWLVVQFSVLADLSEIVHLTDLCISALRLTKLLFKC